MKKSMKEITVQENDGEIQIIQPNYPDDDIMVVLHPDQIDLVSKWLEQAEVSSKKSQATIEIDELMPLVVDFLDSFWAVFDNDWDVTKVNMNSIEPGATFIKPGVDDESNNWFARGGLLSSYRKLLSKLEEHDIEIPSNF